MMPGKIIVALVVVGLAGPASAGSAPAEPAADRAEIERMWKSGGTLPAEVAAKHPLPNLRLRGDTGVNVLVDLAHQCLFATMWSLPQALHREGFRAVGSQATLDTVLAPGKPSRVRIPAGGHWPFAWWPNPKFNVVFTHQDGPHNQEYLPEEPMFLILSAGGGGGWAVNAYLPKEVGVISLSRLGVISIFAHELAHTMSGPRNARGQAAGDWPHGNQGESHAGWFQGKIVAKYTDNKIVKDCNALFAFDRKGDALDLAAPGAELQEKWGKGREWTKIWWVFQKLDDRYGPTWYPRWRWVQHTRWQDEPARRLSWDEMVEDMSIAVGEDLFGFFRRIGTTLKRDRLERIAFQGKTLELPVAPLEVTPAGEAKLGAIGDYTRPIHLRRPGPAEKPAPPPRAEGASSPRPRAAGR